MTDDNLIQAGGTSESLVDEPVEELAPEGMPLEEEKPKKTGFLSTTLGKILVIGGAISLLLCFVAVVAFLVLTFVVGQGVEEALDDMTQQVQEQITETTEEAAEEVAQEPDAAVPGPLTHSDVTFERVYSWRNIFQPMLTPYDASATVDATGTAPTTTTGGGSTYSSNTLYLLDILTGTSEEAAQFYYNGIDYNTTTEFPSEDHIAVLEGDRLSDTAWRLLSIGVTSVTLQYGDSTVTLSIGQGIQK